MTITVGIDIGTGTGAVKTVLFRSEGDTPEWLARRVERIRRRDPQVLAETAYGEMLEEAGIAADEVGFIAASREGENVPFRTGHFYSMTTHARGGVHLAPGISAVLDVGALHGRAISIDPRGKVLAYKMTSQCASGSGQFLEHISRYLGIAVDEVGELSISADDSEKVSGICAVLAETDVINMVSRGISTPNVLKGIHLSMAMRLVRLLKATKLRDGRALMTGGLAADAGLLTAMREQVVEQKINVEVEAHPDSIYAGAIGAALWGAFRHERLAALGQRARAS